MKLSENKKDSQLGSVVYINPSSVGKDYPYDEIEYIDISSVGCGVLLERTPYILANAPGRAKRLVSNGDTILSTVRPNRRSFLFIKRPPSNLVVSTGFAVLRPSERIDPRFLYYILTNQPFTDYLTANAKGSAYPAVDTDTIARAKVYLPDLLIQEKIASILSAYDDLIENNNKRIKILEEMAQAIYREWFVNFRFPGHKKVKMVKSKLGMTPEGWEVKQLGDVVELAYGKALKAEDRIPGPVPVYGSSGIVGYHNEGTVNGPGIVVGRKGNVGSVVWADDDFYPIDTAFYVKTNLSLHYVYYNLRGQKFINADAAVPGLNRNQAYRNVFLVPDAKILGEFQDVIDSLFGYIRTLTTKNENLRRTRDLLLPKLISGEIDIKIINA